jgi:hypothetical protein
MQTGADLAVNPNVTFFETGSIAGSALDFTSGTVGMDRMLFRWDFLPASSRGQLTVTISVDFTPLTLDNDFRFGLTDDVSINGWSRADNDGGSAYRAEGPVSGTDVAHLNYTLAQLGLGAVQPLTLTYNLPDDAGGTQFQITEGAASASTSFIVNPLAGDNALSFFMARNHTDEGYRLNSLSITVDEVSAVPEPASIALFALGLASLGASRYGRQRAGEGISSAS